MNLENFIDKQAAKRRNVIDNWADHAERDASRLVEKGVMTEERFEELRHYIAELRAELLSAAGLSYDDDEPESEDEMQERFHMEHEAAERIHDDDDARTREALKALHPCLRQALTHYHVFGGELEEQAESLNIPPAIYTSRLSEAHVMFALMMEVGPEKFAPARLGA